MAEQSTGDFSTLKTSPKKKVPPVGRWKVTKMIREPKSLQKLTPSSYLAEMSLTTEEKLAATVEMYPPKIIELIDIASTGTQKEFSVDIDQALFQPFPSEVVFQQFEKHKSYEFPLSLRNLDRVARHVKVIEDASPYFSISCNKPIGQKIAPGMEVCFVIQFTPNEDKDYNHELIFVTEREKFTVPIKAIGARALLDFPNDISFTSVPVKYNSSKTILVRNIGKKDADFKLETTKPFSVTPTQYTLPIGSCIQVHIEFLPMKCGDHTSELIIHYDTGETIYVSLYGTATDVNVRLDKNSITLDNTYIGLCTQRTVTLHNRSNIVAHYEWKMNSSLPEDELQRDIIKQTLNDEEHNSKNTLLERCLHNPLLRDRLPILSHSYDTKKTIVNNDKLLYFNDIFSLDPVEGDIWPNSFAEITITFQPEKATNYSSVTYCDITGRESRLPLKLRGEGLGPKLRFSFDKLDIQNIFINSSHAYEVILENQGDIDGSYTLQSPTGLFGPKFTFIPSTGNLQPDGLQVIQISFSSSTLGSFNEEFIWNIEGAVEPLKFNITGTVIGPTFQFNHSLISYGTVAYGFPISREVVLQNTSEVSMSYALHIPTDVDRKQFTIQPRKGMLPPNMQQNFKVTLIPVEVKTFNTVLAIDISEVGNEVYTLPIQAICVVPQIHVNTRVLDYGRCFILHPYTLDIQLCNSSNLRVRYNMNEQAKDSTIECFTTNPKGVIEPHQNLTLPFTIRANTVGHLKSTAAISISGSTEPPLQVELHCIGEGPVINITPEIVDWGVVPVLTPVIKKLTISNESEIDAEFQTYLMKENSVFTVQPVTDIIPPHKKLEMTIVAELDDNIKFIDKLTISVKQGVRHTISLLAEGTGSTIVSIPSLNPCVNLGTHFACSQCRQQFTLTNRGRRSQALSWSTEGFSMAKLKKAELEKSMLDKSDVRTKSLLKPKSNSSLIKKPMFQIIPDKFVLQSLESQTVLITAYSTNPREVKERIVCHGIIGKNPHKERIMTVDVMCTFIAPLLQFSSKEVHFSMEQKPGSDLLKHTQTIQVKNISPLSLSTLLSSNYPFNLCASDSNQYNVNQELLLDPNESVSLSIQYDSSYCVDRVTRNEKQCIEVSYKEHPQKDYVDLFANVFFPNLDFTTKHINFGSILNNTEIIQTITMSNNSPLEVRYTWSFLKKPPVRRDPLHDDEGVDMESECESDSLEESSTTSLQQQQQEEGGGEETQTLEVEETLEVKADREGCDEDADNIRPSIEHVSFSTTTKHSEKEQENELAVTVTPSDSCHKSDKNVFSQSLPPSEPSETTVDDDQLNEGAVSPPQPWRAVYDPFKPISIDQVFDILPLFGVLQPGESQDVQMTFFGHSDISTEVIAVCKVEGGPAYELILAGEASDIQYRIDNQYIYLGSVVYDGICSAEITLSNIGKVSLEYHMLDGIGENMIDLAPGQVSVSPAKGEIGSLETQTLRIKYYPGIPHEFHKLIKLQVAHFEPDTITLAGDATYPRLSLSVPRFVIDDPTSTIYKTAIERLNERKKTEYTIEEVEKEVENITIAKFVQDNNIQYFNGSKSTKLKPTLPEYTLDFGYIIYGLVTTRTVTLTNIGNYPLSFNLPQSSLSGTGFSIDLGKRVKSLSIEDCIEFTVTFDPAGAKRSLGYVESTLPFQVIGGPIYPLILKAEVVLPTMNISNQTLDFGTVICGQCRIITLRLHNPLQVKCDWTAITDKPPKKLPKHTPMHLRKKIKEKPPPKYFEVEPTKGILLPDQKMDIQIRFMPSEEYHYSDKIPFIIDQNSQADLHILVQGQGTEPLVVFDKSLVEFPPILPFSSGTEIEVIMSNPLDYPVEVYSIEFDKQYLEEEEVLRWVKGYDKKNRLYLPPIETGKGLPYEIMEAYRKEKLVNLASSHELLEPPDIAVEGSNTSVTDKTTSQGDSEQKPAEIKSPYISSAALIPHEESITMLSNATVGSILSELHVEGLNASPVAACIARYLGIDVSPEAALAEARRGIVFVLYGPPHCGKTTQSQKLSQLYAIPVLTIDGLVIDAISSASTPAGVKARLQCMEVTHEIREMEAEVVAQNIETPIASKASIGAQRRGSRLIGSGKDPASFVDAKKELHKSFNVLPLSESEYSVPDGVLFAAKLSEEDVIEIVSDRLMGTDCRKGMVFDGLQSMFTSDQLMSCAVLLKAFSNRKNIYFVDLEIDMDNVKSRVLEIEKEKQRQLEEEQKIKQQEEDRIQSLLDLSEDDYEALPAEKKKEIDEIRLKRYMLRKEKARKQKEERERIEKERIREEEQRLEEEKAKAKKGRGGKDHFKSSPGHTQGSRPESIHSQFGGGLGQGPHGMSAASIASYTDSQAGGRKKSTKAQIFLKESPRDDEILALEDEKLKKEFHLYENCKQSIKNLLDDWDRAKGIVRPKKIIPPPTEMDEKTSKSTTTPKKKPKKISKIDTSPQTVLPATTPVDMAAQEEEESREGVGIPLLCVHGNKPRDDILTAIKQQLPTPEEILKDLGISLEGAPIPDPVTFQVYHYPLKRHSIQQTLLEHFHFLDNIESEPSFVIQEETTTSKANLEIVTDVKEQAVDPLAASSAGKRSSSTRSKDDVRKRSVSVKSRQQSKGSSPSSQNQEDIVLSDEQINEQPDIIINKLENYRWIIPARGDCKLRLLFTSQTEGQFDQTLNFEILGTRRHYQLFCRGLCQLPTISREPRIVFTNRKRTIKKGEIVSKRYILDTDEYLFGPLHCGKPRERYREGRYPENMESLTISNSGNMESLVTFCFRNDSSGVTFLLEPNEMLLQPGESKPLSVWAYPKAVGEFKDSLVCSVQHNPYLVLFPISCHGVEPELKVDKKLLDFGKVLLHRRETRVLNLRNNTLLPAAWKLSGIETLGDEISFSQEQGIVQPKSEFPLNIHFRAVKPTLFNKKAFKIEISDVEQIIGLMHVENIQLIAEAYDVALDISFPKGAEGGLDFGCLRVFDDVKLAMQVKNRGKYEIAYNFSFDVNPSGLNYSKLFLLNPVTSTLAAGEKSQSVTISFKPDRELVIKDQPLLKCQVIDRHIGEHGEVIASIPIRISAKAVFSKYKVTPTNEVNFGSLVVGTRKSASFTIENKGDFEFRYAVTKRLSPEIQKLRQAAQVSPAQQQSNIGQNKRGKGELASASRSSSIVSKLNLHPHKKESLRYEIMGGSSQRLVIGLFTITPATGIISPGQSLTINIDCVADKQGKHEELLSIEMSDSNRHEMPLTYKIFGEIFVPAINSSDVASIFEEHRICRQLGMLGLHEFHEDGCVGVYGENERRFVYKSVIVGNTAKARFKIINSNKVSCDVNISVKSMFASSRQRGATEAFEVTPTRAQILPHSYIYSTVTFKPLAMQMYNAVFEVVVDGPTQTKGKGLTFDLQGEGNLPQVAVAKPRTRSAKGDSILLFKKLLLGQRQKLPVVIENSGNIPATVSLKLDTQGQDGFYISSPEESHESEEEEEEIDSASVHPLTLFIPEGSSKEVSVIFQPESIQQYTGCIWLHTKDNQFETIPITVVGEGYQSDIVIGNIRRHCSSSHFVESRQIIEGIEAIKDSNLNFGVCPVGEPVNLTFTLTNLSHTDPIRFQWPTVPCLMFTPSLGHIHPAASKDILVTFSFAKPKEYKQQRFAGKFWKIAYTKPINQVSDWDDSMKTVKWVNVPPQPSSESRPPSSSSGSKKQDTVPATTTTGEEVSVIPPAQPPLKNKVIETESEPEHKLLDKTGDDLEVFLTAETSFADYECPSRIIRFKDTYILQTKVYQFPLKNTSKITLSYKWFILEQSQIADSITTDDISQEVSMEDKLEECLVTIEPQCGEIPPGEEQIISVRFSPVEVVDVAYKFRCKMSHLKASTKPLQLHVQCNSIVPYCHFDLPESDYLTIRRPPDIKGAGSYADKINRSTKVIEFVSTGTTNKIIKTFNITNPTDRSYEFQWTQLTEGPSYTSPTFKCHTPKGQIPGGKKYEVKFEYTPANKEYVESFWNFIVPSLSLSFPFLLVGHLKEPNVNLDRSYLTFRSMLIGSTSSETVYLINTEDKPYQFTVNENSCCSHNHNAKLNVIPMSGIISPKEKFPLHVSFTAIEEREFIFRLVCNIKGKRLPLSLNVKAEGYGINMSLSAIDSQGEETQFSIDKASKRIIDFGKVPINDRGMYSLVIQNNSQFNINCRWNLSSGCLKRGGAEKQLVNVKPLERVIAAHSQRKCELIFAPATSQSLKNSELTLYVANGPVLPITLKGSGTEPKVMFSFTEYNFGPRFLHHPNMPPNITTLTITNKDTKEITIECLYTNSNSHIELLLDSALNVIAPDETIDIDCYFRPYEPVKYTEQVVFEINGLVKKIVSISGEGALVKVESSQKIVNIGALLVKEKFKKKVKLTNKSPLAIQFVVNILPSAQSPELHEEGVLAVSFCPSKSQQLINKKEINLKPGEDIFVEVAFSPTVRVSQFSEEVTMESHGLSYSLFVVKGSCQGLDISLDSENVPFGAVVLHSKSKRRIKMINSGDIGARFQWNIEKFAPDFSISPVKGYISTGMEVPFDIEFHPTKVHNDIRYNNLLCHIEGGSSLPLTLSGVCIEQTPLKEMLHFTTTVRSKETKHITIHNKTSMPWLLHPVIDGEYWSGSVSLSVGAGQSAQYELVYHPLLMTQDSHKHQGSVFFPMPDGSGLLYNLIGTADGPKHSGSIVQEIPCKTSHVELLTVHNWLRQSQRFRAHIELVRPEKLDRSVTLYGVDYIDVPAGGNKDYKVHFYSFKEGSFLAKVTFVNEQTGEYQFFHIHFKSVSAGIISTIELTTPVRQNISHTITIDNPFSSPININTSVNVSDISLPTSFLVGAESQGKCTFEYLPLKPDESIGKLTLQCNELGSYHYELHLKALPAAPEKPVHFTTTLGSSQTLSCIFTSYAKGRIEYSCKIDNPDFHVDKSVTVSTSEVSVDVNFEPSTLGDTHATLSISSPTGGDYIIPLHGHCLVPKPQGPYSIKAGGNITIPFKNVFHQTHPFSFSIDNPVFNVKASDNLKPRKLYNILVHFDGKQADANLVKLGKLTVTCKGSGKVGGGNLKWVYYLKGLAIDK